MPSDEDLQVGNLTIVREDLEQPQTGDEDVIDGKPALKTDPDASELEQKLIEEDVGERMDRDYQISTDFKDELIPLSYEYFMNIVDHGEIDDTDSEDIEDGDQDKSEDYDSDGNKKHKNKKQKEECKQ